VRQESIQKKKERAENYEALLKPQETKLLKLQKRLEEKV
jgi:hypothetical protein